MNVALLSFIVDVVQVLYMLVGIVFAYQVDKKARRGFIMQLGFIFYSPFVLVVLFFNRQAFDHYKNS